MQKRFKLATLGCRTNSYETQGFRDQLLEMGYLPAEEGQEADLCIVNTCTVTESADSASRHEVRKLLREQPNAKLVVTGCSAERDSQALQAISPNVQIVSNAEKEGLVSKLFPDEDVPEFSIKNFDAHTRAFVKVQDGCNSFCTYCIIPYVRGRSKSRKIDAILKEVKDLVANGFKEIVITGINVGDFEDPPYRLADLIRMIDAVDGVERLRVSSIDPDEVDEALAFAILEGRATCPSMHIVLQSGSNVMLKRMNRKYTRQIFLETVEKLKKARPDFTFTTDVIVGFPGETEEDFQQTLEVMREVQFAKVHMFPYSRRKRTRAALYPDQLPPKLIQQRKVLVLQEAEKIGFAMREGFVGQKMTVLTEQKAPSFGHSIHFLPVFIEGKEVPANEIVHVDIIANRADGLVGRVCEEH